LETFEVYQVSEYYKKVNSPHTTMTQNTTDFIAQKAFEATKTNWKLFVLFPILLSLTPLVPIFLMEQTQLLKADSLNIILISAVLLIAYLVVFAIFKTAVTFWCQAIHKGKKVKFKDGMAYGKSRFWGVLWTGFITIVKIILWSLLLVLPGIYKTLMYIHSLHASRLEKLSGSDANQISQTLVRGSGTLRTMGNMMSVFTVVILSTYILFAVVFVATYLLMTSNPVAAEIVSAVIISFISMTAGMYLEVFMNFQYLYYRDENKNALSKLKRRFAKLNR
jgi:hypothetical protein